jgi:formylglycine-generating enzyme required for sulfatase activity
MTDLEEGQKKQDDSGSGAIAQGDGATAVGENGVNVGGNLSGALIQGEKNQVIQNSTIYMVSELPAAQKAVESDEPAPGEPPYMGLRYFDTADAALFYGRAALTRELAARLAGERFLAIVGASGSGKSSVARAGLLPAWEKGLDIPGGRLSGVAHVLTPGIHPLESLAASLTRQSESVTATATLMDDLARDPRSLHLYVRKLLSLSGGTHLLLLVDQFEETFTLCKDPAERKAFIENLLAAADEENGGPLRVVLTLRADFYHRCAEYDGLRQALQEHQEYIGAMSADELREAITAPAQAAGWDLQPGLVELILQDVGQEPGALPLLSHALLETWKRREGHTLTLAGYAAAGGVRKAIAQTADSVYDRLPPAEKLIARNIFLQLTELGEGAQDTRRLASLQELAPAPGQQAAMEAVLKTLSDARLVTTDRDSVQVAHEALIREWPALRRWLDEGRQELRLHRHLTESAREWERRARDPGELYRGARLLQAQEWAANRASQLNPLERAFLQASRDALLRERRAARQREHRDARQRWAALAAAALLTLTLTLTLIILAWEGQLTAQSNRLKYPPVDMTNYWTPIPAGTFWMGSETGDANEKPVHSVTLNAFEMGRYEVTNRQYAQCVHADICSKPSNSATYDDEKFASFPVTDATWNDARTFCSWADAGGRLPTEAEWEYAARGGKESMTYPWGNEAPTCAKGAKNGANFGGGGDCPVSTMPVGSFAPNGYGLYDMAGNVWEWVSDWYGDTYYASSPTSNPQGPATGDSRVLRGGSWNFNPNLLRVSLRGRYSPGYWDIDDGFRCARSAASP